MRDYIYFEFYTFGTEDGAELDTAVVAIDVSAFVASVTLLFPFFFDILLFKGIYYGSYFSFIYSDFPLLSS